MNCAPNLGSPEIARGWMKHAGGKDLVGRCPFHGPDDEPSFVVTPSKGLFHCFGCGAKRVLIAYDRDSAGDRGTQTVVD